MGIINMYKNQQKNLLSFTEILRRSVTFTIFINYMKILNINLSKSTF